ncbi:MAG: acetyltransferase [Microscillaceae bacterium]
MTVANPAYVLFGAGGHAAAIYDTLLSKGLTLCGVFDQDIAKNTFFSLPVQHHYQPDSWKQALCLVAIGHNATRRYWASQIAHSFGGVVHDRAYVSPLATLGEGTVVMAQASVQARAQIGRHVILNTACVVEHDCQVADFAHIAPGTVLGGAVKVGAGTLVGANATVLAGLSIGHNCVIGAGSVVTQSIPSGWIAYGVPAHLIRENA